MSSEEGRSLALDSLKAMLSPSQGQGIEYAVVDAFSEGPFGGNPAAVVLLSEWKDDKWLQNIAAEFNLSETAFIKKKEKKVIDEEEEENAKAKAQPTEGAGEKTDGKSEGDAESKTKNVSEDSTPKIKLVLHEYELRWFTPKNEVDLCGHATLASAHLLYHAGIAGKKDTIFFHTKSGLLSTRSVGPKEGDAQNDLSVGKETPMVDLVELNFPWVTTTPCGESEVKALPEMLNTEVVAAGKASNYLIAELESSDKVEKLQPKMQDLLNLDSDGLLATAPAAESSGFDFVSRCFFPKFGVDEDPVTGMAHCILGPYWSTRLKKNHMLAYQASKRGGALGIQVDKKIGRVYLRGQAVVIMSGVLLQ